MILTLLLIAESKAGFFDIFTAGPKALIDTVTGKDKDSERRAAEKVNEANIIAENNRREIEIKKIDASKTINAENNKKDIEIAGIKSNTEQHVSNNKLYGDVAVSAIGLGGTAFSLWNKSSISNAQIESQNKAMAVHTLNTRISSLTEYEKILRKKLFEDLGNSSIRRELDSILEEINECKNQINSILGVKTKTKSNNSTDDINKSLYKKYYA